ncbi:MAG: IPT/TIG domain-containing protein [Polyangiales bacterium]
MRKLGGITGVIIGAVVLLAGCDKPRGDMAFQQLDPDFGGLQGGKTVRVVGQNLRLDIGYAVYFGRQRSPQVSIQNEKALLAVTPRRFEPGPVDVTIRADNGSVFVVNKGFEYINQAGNLLEEAEAE